MLIRRLPITGASLAELRARLWGNPYARLQTGMYLGLSLLACSILAAAWIKDPSRGHAIPPVALPIQAPLAGLIALAYGLALSLLSAAKARSSIATHWIRWTVTPVQAQREFAFNVLLRLSLQTAIFYAFALYAMARGRLSPTGASLAQTAVLVGAAAGLAWHVATQKGMDSNAFPAPETTRCPSILARDRPIQSLQLPRPRQSLFIAMVALGLTLSISVAAALLQQPRLLYLASGVAALGLTGLLMSLDAGVGKLARFLAHLTPLTWKTLTHLLMLPGLLALGLWLPLAACAIALGHSNFVLLLFLALPIVVNALLIWMIGDSIAARGRRPEPHVLLHTTIVAFCLSGPPVSMLLACLHTILLVRALQNAWNLVAHAA